MRLSILASISLGLASPAFAEEKGNKGERGEPRGRPAPTELIEEFDDDGDGALNAEELQAVMDAHGEGKKEFRTKIEDRMKAMRKNWGHRGCRKQGKKAAE